MSVEREARELLVGALELVKRGHCRAAAARGRGGEPLSEADPLAVAFCPSGAITRAWIELRLRDLPGAYRDGEAPPELGRARTALRDAILRRVQRTRWGDRVEELDPATVIAVWNDTSGPTRDEVLAALSEAAAELDAAGGAR
jgi:hypothetical protein